jgi:hypothetical protein
MTDSIDNCDMKRAEANARALQKRSSSMSQVSNKVTRRGSDNLVEPQLTLQDAERLLERECRKCKRRIRVAMWDGAYRARNSAGATESTLGPNLAVVADLLTELNIAKAAASAAEAAAAKAAGFETWAAMREAPWPKQE